MPLIGALGGYMVAPLLARVNYTVSLANRIMAEDEKRVTGETLESEAFRESGVKSEVLFAQAAITRKQIVLGGALLGAWCGIVVALKIFSSLRTAKRDEYDIDHALCVSCGRCFLYCPRERLRLKQLNESKSAENDV